MHKSLFWMAVAGAVSLSVAGAAEPPSDHATAAAAQEKAAQDLADLCARVTCRKLPRQVSLRMGDNSSFQIGTRMLPYFDDKGTLVIFPGETITLSYAGDDANGFSTDDEPHLGSDHRTIYFSSDRAASVSFPRAHDQAVRDVQRLEQWDNSNSNVWTLKDVT